MTEDISAVPLAWPLRNGNSSSKNYMSPLTEKNLEFHTEMAPVSRENKMHRVLVYVDLQKQLIALEAQLRRENEESRERFDAALPENTPPVIPEVVQIKTQPPLQSSTSSNTIDKIDLPLADDADISDSTPKSQKTINSRIKTKRARRIKLLLKNTAKKITSRISGSSTKNVDFDQPLPSPNSHFDKDSLRVEPSIPPSPSQSTLRSRTSSMRPKAPFKGIFIPSKSSHNRTNSADTINTIQQASPLNNSTPNNSPQHLLFTQSTPATPITNSPAMSRLPNNEGCENNVFKSVSEHRDSGISLVSPAGKSGSSQHSREHSISSLLRRIDLFNTPQKDHSSRTEKNRTGSKGHDSELLAFRYPSLKNMDQIDKEFGTQTTSNDSPTRKQKEKERLVSFGSDDMQEPGTSTNITSFEVDSDNHDNPHPVDDHHVIDISRNEFSLPEIHSKHK